MPKTEEEQKLAQAVKTLEKQFGAGIVVQLGENNKEIPDIPVIHTGLISLDYAIRHPMPERKISIGGIPRGRITELHGPEGGGKSSLIWRIIAEANRAGERAGFVDAEHAVDPKYAASFGVDLKTLMLSQPDYGEQAFEIVQALVESGALSIVVVDSIAALVPKHELEGEFGDAQPGTHARMVTQAMRKLTGIVSKSKTALIVTNQVRVKVKR
jgi:recombination protein RecA